MSEKDTPAGGVPSTSPAPAEPTAAGSEPVEQPTPPATPEGQPQEAPKEPSTTPKDSGKPTEPAPQVPQQPTSRRSARYRIEQLARDNAELRKQVGQPPQNQPDDGNPPADEPLPPQPDISKLVEDAVAKRLNPVMTEHSKAADDGEISELFTGDKAAKRAEFEPKIREAWKLPQYKDLAASDLYKLLTYDADLAAAKLQAVEQFKKAEKEAKESSGSGTSARKDGRDTSAFDLSEEEFKKKTDAVRAGG